MKHADCMRFGICCKLVWPNAALLRATRQTAVAVGVALAFIFNAALAATNTESIVLARAGVAQATILVAREPTPAARLAARELQHSLGQMTGASIPISSNLAEATGVRILVGAVARRLAASDDRLSTPAARRNSGSLTAMTDQAESLAYDIRFLPGSCLARPSGWPGWKSLSKRPKRSPSQPRQKNAYGFGKMAFGSI
jgi:hypothetical protein